MEVRWSQIWRKKFEATIANCSHGNQRLVRWCIVLMENDASREFSSSLGFDLLTELHQKIRVVLPGDCIALRQVVYQQHTFCIPKNRRHHLPSGADGLGFFWSWRTVVLPLFGLLFRLRLKVMNPCFIHRNKLPYKVVRIRIVELQIAAAHVVSSPFVVGCQEPWYPTRRHLCHPQILGMMT